MRSEVPTANTTQPLDKTTQSNQNTPIPKYKRFSVFLNFLKILRIYLADLIHDRHVYNYSVPLNVGYIAAMVNKRLGKSIETQIYKFPEKKIIVVNDVNLSENYLIYIDKIENVAISGSSEEYQKYLNLSKAKIVSELYNTYDSHIQKRYKIDINYQALDIVKNYFN